MSNDPNMRPFLAELTGRLDEFKHWLPCCPNCENWDSKAELCQLNNVAIRPPAPVIAFGCWAYEQAVPF